MVVLEIFKLIEDANLINRRTDKIILSNKLIHKGDESSARYLMTQFYSLGKDKVNCIETEVEE
ncbi:hypothetical protein FDF29_18030 [Clostridium botulinum]|nr:hypothetical protein [Clostridium botulinum]NFQ55179.1 hypothetical protein [Clostridium botulinum]NFT48102.1 hypothetical protein [Clostridium botulinum]